MWIILERRKQGALPVADCVVARSFLSWGLQCNLEAMWKRCFCFSPLRVGDLETTLSPVFLTWPQPRVWILRCSGWSVQRGRLYLGTFLRQNSLTALQPRHSNQDALRSIWFPLQRTSSAAWVSSSRRGSAGFTEKFGQQLTLERKWSTEGHTFQVGLQDEAKGQESWEWGSSIGSVARRGGVRQELPTRLPVTPQKRSQAPQVLPPRLPGTPCTFFSKFWNWSLLGEMITRVK